MSNSKTIVVWVAASLEAAGKYYGSWEIPPSTVIIDHFRTKGVPMTAGILDGIVNDQTSQFNTLITELEVNLVTSGVYDSVRKDDYHIQIAAQQWG
jgi:hypothetical protein